LGGADLTGAGATFPYPIYSKWFDEYATKTGIHINYQPIGSGGGIKQLSEETVDFGASDAPMTDAEMAAARGGPILHVPTVVGVVAVVYNLPSVSQPLRLTGPLVAQIFLGDITRWNDPRIVSINPRVELPAQDILVVHRTEESGTTYIVSDYLSSVSPAWKAAPGTGKQLQWPTGIGGKGNEGVAGLMKSTPGSIGYLELAYVKQNKLSAALLRNASGAFVPPSAASASAAADRAAANMLASSDFRMSIANSPGADSYPIVSLTWLLVYGHQRDTVKARELTDFIRWALTNGQGDAASLDYAPLPAPLVQAVERRLDSIARSPVTR
jgi:phosphate transport system substrate-binding protein